MRGYRLLHRMGYQRKLDSDNEKQKPDLFHLTSGATDYFYLELESHDKAMKERSMKQ